MHYLDCNGDKAIGAQLQSLRIAAADPSSTCLPDKGVLTLDCTCRVNYSQQTLADQQRIHRGDGAAACPNCSGSGKEVLPHRAANPYVPKLAATLQLIREILERKEQVVVFSAFNDPLDFLSRLLGDATVPHLQLDGRTAQKKRGELAARFKLGRPDSEIATRNSELGPSLPVMLAGVECMAEGHSFHRCNNVILIAYSWAYDKFKQALDRVHRMNSEKPVNVYVVLCNGTIDRKLESLVQEKTDSVELALDGRLIGERTEDVSLAELLAIARQEFDAGTVSVDEAAIQRAWPALRAQLQSAADSWAPALLRAPSPVRSAQTLNSQPPRIDWRSQMRALAAQLRRQQRTDTGSDLWSAL